MELWLGLLLLALGVATWLFGTRLWLLGAAAGALLGFGLLRLFPGAMDGVLGLLIVGGLAIALGVLGFIGKAFTKIIALVVGFIAGGAVVTGLLDTFGADLEMMTWLLALIGGGVGAALFARFLDWGLIIFASLVGSLLLVRGATVAFFPDLVGTLGSLLVLLLTAAGIFYHYRKMKPGTAKS